MPICPANPAQRRYNRRVIVASLAYAGLLLIEKYAIRSGVPHGMAYILAVLPALALITIFFSLGRYLIEETDEYLRMRTVRQILWATGLALAATTIWGFLEDAGLPRLPMFWVAVVWFACLGIAGCIVKVTDR